jgi:2-epi-5-epi-valiolone synthase
MLKSLSAKPGESAWSVSANINWSYDVRICKDLLSENAFFNSGYSGNGNVRLIFWDNGLPDELRITFKNAFLKNKQKCHFVLMDCSEEDKNLDNLLIILSAFEEYGIPRKENPVYAIGGGVISDMVGFAASVFRRGVPYIKVPTTLLSLVDTSVGVKTSINHFERRNRLGAFHPPLSVFICPMFLTSLPKQHLSYGLAEIIKISIVKQGELLSIIEDNKSRLLELTFYQCEEGLKIIELACQYMLEELAPNLTEQNLERIVDFGHTFSPIPEMLSLKDDTVDELHHGEAVILDIILTCSLAVSMNRMSLRLFQRILQIIESAGLRMHHTYFSKPELLLESCLDAQKHRAGDLNLPIPSDDGGCIFLKRLSFEEIEKAIAIRDQYCGVSNE